MWDDINLEQQKELYNSIVNSDISLLMDNTSLEAINIQLFIEYNDNDSYTNIQKFMMDLNPENNFIVLEFVLLISAKKIIELRNIALEKNIKDFNTFSKYMTKNFTIFLR